eukprot:m.499131 g.499131  ORF g.499131 m.499131 type:complete len:781 (-) comp21824_c0_seq1:124-2466(-)
MNTKNEAPTCALREGASVAGHDDQHVYEFYHASPTGIQLLVSGGAAGAISRSVTAPLDRVKILYQVDPVRKFTVLKAAKSMGVILKNTGVAGLWRGNGVAVLRIAPFSAISYSTFTVYEGMLQRHMRREKDVFSRFLAGAAAGATATTATYPLDLIRARIAAHWSKTPMYESFWDGASTIVRTEGITSLYSGINPTLLGIVPYAGISFAIFESLKSFASRSPLLAIDKNQDTMLPPPALTTIQRLVCGGVAGLIAQTATYPLHVIRRRMQVQGSPIDPSNMRHIPGTNMSMSATTSAGEVVSNQSVVRALRLLYATEGWHGMFKGVTLSWLKAPVAVALSFTINDGLKDSFTSYEHRKIQDEIDTYGSPLVRRKRGEYYYYESPLEQTVARPHLQEPGEPVVIVERQPGMTTGLAHTPASVMEPPPHSSEPSATEHSVGTTTGDTPTHSDLPVCHTHAPSEAQHQKLLHHDAAENLPLIYKFISGGVAGAVAKTVIAPADRVKILYQVNPHREFSLSRALKTGNQIIQHSGPVALWRGNMATLLRVIPYSSITYATFDRYQYMLSTYLWEERNFWTRFFAGAAAGATATSLTYPMDLLRARKAAHWSVRPIGYLEALKNVYRSQGELAMFNGLKPTLLGIVPYAGSSFAFFETMKDRYLIAKGLRDESQVPTHVRLVFGGVAGLVAQSLTYPLDIVRRRMQVDQTGAYRNMVDCVQTILRTEGVWAFYKGLSMNWIKGPIAVSVSFVVNDKVKNWFRKRQGLEASSAYGGSGEAKPTTGK